MRRDIDGGPAQNPRGVREGGTVCLKADGHGAHRPTGVVRSIDGEGRYALVEWHDRRRKRSTHTLRELVPA